MPNYFLYLYIGAALLIIFLPIFYIFFSRSQKRKNLFGSLDLVLYEISFPQEVKTKEERKNHKEFISLMEQFYAGMSSVKFSYVLEIGLPFSGDEVVFYSAIPRERAQLFEKQVHGLFPLAEIKIKKDDYNIFKPEGYSLGSIVKLKKEFLLPIKTYDKFELDPLQTVINAFSKLQKEGEGAALQIIVSPTKEDFAKMAKSASLKIREGKSFHEAVKGEKSLIAEFFETVKYLIFGYPDSSKKENATPKSIDEELAKLFEVKASRQIMSVNIRLMVSSNNKNKADTILSELESVFLQFGDIQGNNFYFFRPKGGYLRKLFYKFCFRISDKNNSIPLNTAELATIFHFPSEISSIATPQLKYVKTKESAPPLNLPDRGILIGRNIYRGQEKFVYMKDDDRRRHFYIIGQTGTGKSVLLKNMIVQDIENGKGVCFIDPHGSDLQDILSRIPKKRIDDLIYFNPGDVSRPMGLNMLEYDPQYPEQKTFIINELIGIFNKLFDMKIAGGPMFEQYFRNATMLVMDDPESGNTLLEISRVMSDKNFRDYKLSKSNNPVVKSFWRDVAEKAGGEAALQNMVPYITSKFDTFLSNDIMRPIIAQEKSAFNFRKIMDEEKILLVNLSKGRLGDINSSLLGLIIVGKLLMSSFSRVDLPESQRKDFYLYIDEFQNVTTDSIATILSEARKYKLNLTIAHQYIGQLEENIKKAVFGNVGSMSAFRVGAEDGEFLEKQFEPVFTSHDLINLDNYNSYLKLLIDGQTARPFNMQTLAFKPGDPNWARDIAQLSSSRYAKTRREVEEEINKRYM
ncbi:DUF87 domain-containing protein [Patescibacteria group bacterium]|nr:DUF87 domain-containing protein [Patescibacteria group bacterium]